MSRAIQRLTSSRWSHCAIYVGRLSEIPDRPLRLRLYSFFQGDVRQPLIIEAQMGEGVVVKPLEKYRHHNLQHCCPRGLSRQDRYKVVGHAIDLLGCSYDIRLIGKLAILLWVQRMLLCRTEFPIYPSDPSYRRLICTRLIKQSFESVGFSLMPRNSRMLRADKGFKEGAVYLTPNIFSQSPNFRALNYFRARQAEPSHWRATLSPSLAFLPGACEKEIPTCAMR